MPLVFLQPVVIFEDRATLGATDQQIYDITSIEQPLLSIWSGFVRSYLACLPQSVLSSMTLVTSVAPQRRIPSCTSTTAIFLRRVRSGQLT